MVGLLARESLVLSPVQIAALVLNALAWLTVRDIRAAAAWSLGSAGWVFWGVTLCFDTRITWQHVNALQGRVLTLSEIPNVPHLFSNPPLWSWYVSAFPSYAWQQVTAIALSGVILGCCVSLFGQTARVVAASPLFYLCCSQPLPGLYALAWLLVGRVAWHQGRHWLAISFVLLACCTKYTVYGVLPFFVWEFGILSAWIGVGLVGYWLWFSQTESLLYARQARWLLSHFTLSLSTGKTAYIVRKNTGYRLPRFLHSGMGALWYLWPMVPVMRLYWVAMAGALLFGGGNIKYLLPMLACLPTNTYG